MRVKRTSGGGASVVRSTLDQWPLGDGLAKRRKIDRLIKECDSLVRAIPMSLCANIQGVDLYSIFTNTLQIVQSS